MKKFVRRPSIIHYIGIVENVDDTILNYPLENEYRFQKLESKLLKAIIDDARIFSPFHDFSGYSSITSMLRRRDEVYCIRRDHPDFGSHFYPSTSERVEKLKLDLTIRLMRLTTPCKIHMTSEYQVASIDNKLSVSSLKTNAEEFYRDDEIVPLNKLQIQQSKIFIDKLLEKFVAKTDSESEKKLKSMFERPFFHPTCDLAFQNYELSFTVKNSGLAFLVLITTLEVLFGSGAHRVARNAAVLLGDNKNESVSIFEDLLTLHGKRSKFLHSGKIHVIKQDDVDKCREYCRKCIVEIYKLNKPKEVLLELLNTMGFGDRPALEYK